MKDIMQIKTTLLFNLLTTLGILDFINLMIYKKFINIYINSLNMVLKIT